MSASDDTTDAVAEAREMIARMQNQDDHRGGTDPYRRVMSALLARIDDLEAKLAAVTRERDRANDIIAAIDAGEVRQTADVTERDD